MQKYRKKPAVIEAIQFVGTPPDGTNLDEITGWMSRNEVYPAVSLTVDDDVVIEIETLEGTMAAGPGDWIIRGTHGEFYPIKDHIFKANYERVDE